MIAELKAEEIRSASQPSCVPNLGISLTPYPDPAPSRAMLRSNAHWHHSRCRSHLLSSPTCVPLQKRFKIKLNITRDQQNRCNGISAIESLQSKHCNESLQSNRYNPNHCNQIAAIEPLLLQSQQCNLITAIESLQSKSLSFIISM
jgi:hypothetical protein